MVLEPSRRLPFSDQAKPDPRLVELVRMLARRAANDFIETEGKLKAGDRLLE